MLWCQLHTLTSTGERVEEYVSILPPGHHQLIIARNNHTVDGPTMTLCVEERVG